ncbi:Atxe2 family lasso peptide isopeptidase (plasmid) [Asticcacaulis sp. DW145]|uniref:Atxe2 family lasso peptide isopeptidase n=1 Tax=Asticcacaulis sp. DW145 TaxID=3095608 RepID=UPI0030904F49|nr:Atxe2 family lasso peptide isopeptidase [Asticcacaulis sp. DW145]
MRSIILAGLVGCALVAPGIASAASKYCSDLLPGLPELNQKRRIEAEDLVRLRDIGPNWSSAREPMLSLSPDGTKLAFAMYRADIASNSYCSGVFVLDTESGAPPKLVSEGGVYFFLQRSSYGIASFKDASVATVVPQWTPDGRSLAFLREENGRVQVWSVLADGGQRRQLTNEPYNIENFAWTANGKAIVFSGRPELESKKEELKEEAKVGYLYDERFAPRLGNTPQILEPVVVQYQTMDVETRTLRAATGPEIALLTEGSRAIFDKDAMVTSLGAHGAKAWTMGDKGDPTYSPTTLFAQTASGRSGKCSDAACDSVRALWWLSDGETLIFLQRKPYGNQKTYYRWRVGAASPTLLLRTTDVIGECTPHKRGLICLHEASRQPRRIVTFDASNGKIFPVFDPNPEFKSIHLGSVERLTWRNEQGVETFGDLVLPPDHKPGQIHPLVVTSYSSNGFLRGATTDEYPIQLFASRGYAVLSFSRPLQAGKVLGGKSSLEISHLDRKDWADRKLVHSLLLSGVEAVLSKGVADPKRVAITGSSEGAALTQWAILHSNVFSAAIMTNCCLDPILRKTLNGPQIIAKLKAEIGEPDLTDTDQLAYWKPMSMRLNADKMNVPLLLELSENEYMMATEGLTALSEKNKTVEAYVFPDEYHVKWQPLHRLAIYNRNLEWLDFWFKGVENPDPAKIKQNERWRKLRDARPH